MHTEGKPGRHPMMSSKCVQLCRRRWHVIQRNESWVVCAQSATTRCAAVSAQVFQEMDTETEEMSMGSLGKCLEAKLGVELGDLRPPCRSALCKRWKEGRLDASFSCCTEKGRQGYEQKGSS